MLGNLCVAGSGEMHTVERDRGIVEVHSAAHVDMPEVRMVSEAAAQHAQHRSLLIHLDLAEVRLRNDDDTLLPVQHVVDRAED